MLRVSLKRFLCSLLRIGIAVLGVGLVVLTGIWFYVTQPVWVGASVTGTSVDPERMRTLVRFLSEECYPRNFLRQDNLEKAAAEIERHFRLAGATTSRQTFTGMNRSYDNVVGFFDGEGEHRLVIGAHYDSAHDTPGADDNASGVAGLVELAHRLGDAELPCDVELVAYCLEEPPFFGTDEMGSHAHAEALADAGVEVAGMICLEMIGYFSDEPDSQSYPLPIFRSVYPTRGNFIAVIARPSERDMVAKVKRSMIQVKGLPVESLVGPEHIPGIDFSDHRNYWKFGFPAVMITDTAFYRNRMYHELGDTWDRLDYGRMARVVEAVAQVVERWEPEPE